MNVSGIPGGMTTGATSTLLPRSIKLLIGAAPALLRFPMPPLLLISLPLLSTPLLAVWSALTNSAPGALLVPPKGPSAGIVHSS